MSEYREYGVMHPGGQMIEPQGTYPFRSLRMARALAADLDEEGCTCDEKGRHRVMVRTVSEWVTT